MVSGGETPKCSCKNRAPIRSAVSSFQISGRYNVHARETRASRAEVKEGNDRVESKRGKFLFDSVVSPDRPVSRNSSSFPRHPPLYKRLVPFLIFLLSSYLSLSLSLSLSRTLSSSLYAHPSHHLCSFCRPCSYSTYIPTHPPFEPGVNGLFRLGPTGN